MKKILSVFALILMLAVSTPASALTSGQYLGGQTYSLAGSGISASASSITLTSLTLPQNGYKILDSDLDALFHVTLEPGNRTRQEFVDCTTVVQNAGGTATLSGCTRGMSGVFPYTASTTQAFSHSGGSTLVFSNTPSLYYDLILYAQSLAFAGAPDASTVVKGLSELATSLEIAASTPTGGSGPLVIPASLATSTFNAATAGNKVVVTGVGGKIDPNFIDLSTGSFTFGTTSINVGAFPAYNIGKNIQVISTLGTSTLAIPSGITKLFVEVQGAGGGGGSGNTNTNGSNGGSAGGYGYEMVDVTGTSTVQLYVGTAGAGGVAGTNNGNAGQWTTFGTNGFYLSANGGNGGIASCSNQANSVGGTATGGDVNISGGPANHCLTVSGTTIGAAGGMSQLGTGGSYSYLGSSGSTAGISASGFGAGGGGAVVSGTGQSPVAGGNGSNGVVIVHW